MTVISLLSDEPEVIDLTSSPPKTPHRGEAETPPKWSETPRRHALIESSSPLFEHEILKKCEDALNDASKKSAAREPTFDEVRQKLARILDAPSKSRETVSKSERPLERTVCRSRSRPGEKKATNLNGRSQEPQDILSKIIEDGRQLEMFHKACQSRAQSDVKSAPRAAAAPVVPAPSMASPVASPAASPPAPAASLPVPAASSPAQAPLPAASKRSTMADADSEPKKRKPTFKASSRAAAPAAKAATTITDRRKAAQSLWCYVETKDEKWVSELKDQFQAAEAPVTVELRPPSSLEGVTHIVTVMGRYEDEYSEEHQCFMRTAAHNEPMDLAIIALRPAFMDKLGKFTDAEKRSFFERVSQEVGKEHVLFMIPELGQHFRRQVDKFNLAVRNRLNSQSMLGEEPIRPADDFYTDLEAELQIVYGIRAFYPRLQSDCAEMVANCVLDLGLQRYTAQLSTDGGSVRSKATTREVVVEALSSIPGLPPRKAQNLGDSTPNLGKLLAALGQSHESRVKRIAEFGKGGWNESLLAFLECEDPDAVI